MVSFKSLLLAAGALSSAVAVDIVVKASGGNVTSGHQYGFLHEDINNSGDGGFYGELIRNRAFQYSPRYPVSLSGWRSVGGASLTLKNLSQPLSKALPVSVNVAGGSGAAVGLQNEGYWGMSVLKQRYTGSFWVKGAYDGVFTAWFLSNLTSDVFAQVEVKSKSKADEWTEHFLDFTPAKDAPSSNNTFAITFDPAGAPAGGLDFNLISLFPPTYKDRKNGLRKDLAEAIAGIHPTILRFPGGNMLEGDNNRSYWNWKDTLGPLKDRPGFQGVWGYQQTHGLGLMEYLYWAEDMGMKNVVAVWAGLALNGDITSKEDLPFYINEALDEIEFIRGPADSKWGSVRAALGHPEPFELRYVEVGNEDWLGGGARGWQTYKDYRFPMFLEAINKAYPDITVIASGASSDGYQVPKPAIGDYHPYREPDSLVEEFDRFDNDFTHIVGEVAATHPNGGIGWDGPLFPYPWWIGTVGESISMIGYERNADRIPGTFFAPVDRNLNRWQWSATLLQHAADPKMTVRSTSWYAWEMLAAHPMKHTLPANQDFDPAFYVAGVGAKDNHILKISVYNTTDSAEVPITVKFEGVKEGTEAVLRLLEGPGDPYAVNDESLVNIVISTTRVIKAGAEGVFSFSMPELSIGTLDTDTSYACTPDKKKKKRSAKTFFA